jgi:hypothetical protein
MTKTTIIAWHHDCHTEVLQQKEPNRYYIPLSYADTETLRSLGAAISDALNAVPVTNNLSESLAQGAPSSTPARN